MMDKIRHFKITYKQRFWGEVLTDTYDKWCTDYELEHDISALYSDPHIISVDYVEIPEVEVKG